MWRGKEGCFKQPSHGVPDSREADLCTRHATAGMVNVTTKIRSDEVCWKYPSHGIAGSRKTEFYSEHATAGMFNVVSKKSGSESCSRVLSYCIACSRKSELYTQHARAGMVHARNSKFDEEGCSKRGRNDEYLANMCDSVELVQRADSSRGLTGGADHGFDGYGRRDSNSARANSGRNDNGSSRRSVCANFKQGSTAPARV